MSNSGRSSISPSPLYGFGARLAHSIASSSDLTWSIQKPATISLLSVNGPSITVRCEPENRTRALFELGLSPPRSRSTPAFVSSSLYFIMSASICSLGITPASESFVALTKIMTRMVLLLGFCAGDRSVLHEGDDRAPVRSTSTRTFFRRAPAPAPAGAPEARSPGEDSGLESCPHSSAAARGNDGPELCCSLALAAQAPLARVQRSIRIATSMSAITFTPLRQRARIQS